MIRVINFLNYQAKFCHGSPVEKFQAHRKYISFSKWLGCHSKYTSKGAIRLLAYFKQLAASVPQGKEKKRKKEKKKERGEKKNMICTGSSFSSKNTHDPQVIGYQVLWLGERPKCTERGWSARRQHRKTQCAPKHTRASIQSPDGRQRLHRPPLLTSRENGKGSQVHSLAMSHFPHPR